MEEYFSKMENIPHYWFEITWMKEKYWTLRISCEWFNNDIMEIINELEDRSSTVCSKCWEKWEIREERQWILTLCDQCNDNR